MTLQAIKDEFQEGLKNTYTNAEIDQLFFWIAEKFLNEKPSTLRAALHENWHEFQKYHPRFQKALAALQEGTPYQYITGEAYFLDFKLYVNNHVLIPRPETEELIEWAMQSLSKYGPDFHGNILDIGTGSGAIAIALKRKFPKATVYALDISQDALNVAENNARANGVNIQFICTDILQDALTELPFMDLIISNPPYIPQAEAVQLSPMVTNFEPWKALFVPDEKPLLFYERIAELGQKKLSGTGEIFVEFHQEFKTEITTLFENLYPKVTPKKDLSGNWRMLNAKGSFRCG